MENLKLWCAGGRRNVEINLSTSQDTELEMRIWCYDYKEMVGFYAKGLDDTLESLNEQFNNKMNGRLEELEEQIRRLKA